MSHAALHNPNAEASTYYGGKNAAGTWQWLIGLMPEHAYYCEPFAGTAATLRRKAPALRSVAIDQDPRVCTWLRRRELPGVEVIHGCGIAWLEAHAAELTADWLLYFDPPYPLETRVKKKLYDHELTADQHRRLLGLAVELPCRVMISSYANRRYEQALATWWREDRDVITRGRTWRTEVVWCNFDPLAIGNQLAQRTWPGRNYRERERIKRKVTRWRRMFAAMPDYERRAVLCELIAEEREKSD